MEAENITTILQFYFTQSDEVTGRGTEELPEELLNQLKRFAHADLPRKELENLAAQIAWNTPATEALAREIKQRWERNPHRS